MQLNITIKNAVVGTTTVEEVKVELTYTPEELIKVVSTYPEIMKILLEASRQE